MNIVMHQHRIQCQSPAGAHTMVVHEWAAGYANHSDQQGQSGLWVPSGSIGTSGTTGNAARGAPVVVCVHGLTRNAADFHALAHALAKDGMRVLAPDIVGRGDSDWLSDPQYYRIDQYCQDILAMVRQLQLGPVYWVGTSMGGLIAMTLLGLFSKSLDELGCTIEKLVLNDVGAEIPHAALSRIADYVGEPLVSSSLEEACQAMRTRMVSFGDHTEEQWRLLTEPAVRRQSNGSWQVNYDLRIAEPFKALMAAGQPQDSSASEPAAMLLWPLYDAISCPTLLLRGALSDLLTGDVAQAMTQRGPKARLEEVPEVGHAPSLVTPEQIERVHQFLK